jgi:hypothetical protein
LLLAPDCPGVSKEAVANFFDKLDDIDTDPVKANKKIDDFVEKIDNIALSCDQKKALVKALGDYPDLKYALLSEPKLLDNWKLLNEKLPDTDKKQWSRNSVAIITRMESKYGNDPIKKAKLAEYYASHKMPSDLNCKLPCVHAASGVEFDIYGHPKFVPNHVPKLANGSIVHVKPAGLDGGSGDFTKANAAAKLAYGDTNFLKNGSTGCKIKDSNGIWVECTWHHHEDGITLIPVPKTVHNSSNPEGAGHTGVASVIDKGIEGFFPSYQF